MTYPDALSRLHRIAGTHAGHSDPYVREIQQDLQDDDCTVWSAEVWVDGVWYGADFDEHYPEGAEIRW